VRVKSDAAGSHKKSIQLGSQASFMANVHKP